MASVMRKVVWLSVLWIAVTLVFPEITRSIPPALLGMSYVLAGALIITAREHLLMLGWVLVDAIVSPLYAIYWAFDKLLDMLAEHIDIGEDR